MWTLGPLSFAAPLALAGLLSLPVLWLLLRATPPAPKRAIFPPLRLLFGAPDDAETPHHAPWWLILFRLLIAALVIVALARPTWTPPSVEEHDGPLLLVIDNGWTSAASWPAISREADQILARAERDGRLAALVLTAPTGQSAPIPQLAQPRDIRRELDAAAPLAWPVDRTAAATRLEAALDEDRLPAGFATTWLSDGIDSAGADTLADLVSARGPLQVHEPDSGRMALALLEPEATPEGLNVNVRRAQSDLPRPVALTALAADGRALARTEGVIDAGAVSTQLELRLPLDLRNRIATLRLDGAGSAGSVRILGDQWQRPRVGLLEAAGEDTQPLLSDLHYIESAISPFSEVRRGPLDELLADQAAVLVMVDDARSDDERIETFVAEGGLLVRFAGPRLAARGDELLPVALREGGRLFGGSLNWEEPQRIAPFAESSPFAGLPSDPTATIDRQVLAEPGSARPDRVWARLEDGTPLVTAERRGRGWIVLFHVTAGPDWSDLPLSGLFPRMLRRTLGLAQGAPATSPTSGAWTIERAISPGGQLATPPASARPVPAAVWETTIAGPENPAGLYRLGPTSAALNIADAATPMDRLPRDLPGASFAGLDGPRSLEFAAPLLIGALILLALDILIALGLAGRLPGLGRGLAAALAGLIVLTHAPDAMAQDDQFAMDAALNLRFAYVLTGDEATDERSRAGLTGLSIELIRRSAMEPAEPMGVNVDTDELIFFPMIYWPVSRDATALSPDAAARVNAYLQGGGLIIFDTQDADIAMLRAGEPHPGLVTILESIDVPPLAQIPSDHVLTRAFYLLQEFPGRHAGGSVWVEANPDGASRDGTSGVVIGANDWASAWATDERGQPIAPVEGGERQREMARRVGVNFAMYALTGNYKADQVHVPDILERLGQ